MVELILGSFALSFVHFLIPNHWLPLVSISTVEHWSDKETLGITLLTALSHTLSTIGLGIAIGLIGYKLANSYQVFTFVAAPLVLIIMGLLYFGMDHHHQHITSNTKIKRKSKIGIIISLCLTMFFSPCLEIEIYYLTAGTYGWKGILAVSLIYLLVSTLGISLMVQLGRRGLKKLKWHWLEHYEKKITGSILIGLGLLSFFIKY